MQDVSCGTLHAGSVLQDVQTVCALPRSLHGKPDSDNGLPTLKKVMRPMYCAIDL